MKVCVFAQREFLKWNRRKWKASSSFSISFEIIITISVRLTIHWTGRVRKSRRSKRREEREREGRIVSEERSDDSFAIDCFFRSAPSSGTLNNCEQAMIRLVEYAMQLTFYTGIYFCLITAAIKVDTTTSCHWVRIQVFFSFFAAETYSRKRRREKLEASNEVEEDVKEKNNASAD